VNLNFFGTLSFYEAFKFLLRKENCDYLEIWNNDFTPRSKREKYGYLREIEYKKEIEKQKAIIYGKTASPKPSNGTKPSNGNGKTKAKEDKKKIEK